MKVICAYCRFLMKQSDSERVSHSICEHCLKLADAEIQLQIEFMQSSAALDGVLNTDSFLPKKRA